MKILSAQKLIDSLNTMMKSAEKHIWIAVPYIGSLVAIKRILGSNWEMNPKIEVKLITDVENVAAISGESLEFFYNRGEIRSLLGLHAKIYIADNQCLITSANLTQTAFERRHEVGIMLDDVSEIKKLFDEYWEKSTQVELQKVLSNINAHKSKSSSQSSENTGQPKLPKPHSKIPPSSQSGTQIKGNPAAYYRIVNDFKAFSEKYEAIATRMWPQHPLYLEIDGLFNFLFHKAKGNPSQKYKDGKVPPQQLAGKKLDYEIKKWAEEYSKWNQTQNGSDIEWRLEKSLCVKQYLTDEKIQSLNEQEIRELLLCTNSMNSDHRNITLILKKNSLPSIAEGLYSLVNNNGTPLTVKMVECLKIKNLGISTVCELIGLKDPVSYPIINMNSISGMRFFGYGASWKIKQLAIQ